MQNHFNKLIRTEDVLQEAFSADQLLELETHAGNADFWNALDGLGIAGPFRVLSPWELEGTRGQHLINAGGYSALPFGESYPPLVDFLQNFLRNNKTVGLPQASLSPWRAALQTNLIRLLAELAPSHADSKVFFSNSGAEAVESAIKFAKAARPKAKYFLNFSSAYHGKTFMALSLTPNAEYQDMFRPLMPGVQTLPYGDTQAFEHAVQKLGPDKIVTVIVEPIQGEAGVITPPQQFLQRIGEICGQHGIPIIADEIQCGLGRTGHWFESLACGLEPDIITLAKPLGGGLVPIGATIVRKEIFRAMLSGFECKRHSNTFGGNAVAMAVGLKSLELLVDHQLPERALRLGTVGLARLQDIQQRYPQFISAVRGQGLLLALQFQTLANMDLAAEASSLLAMRELYQAGILANVSLSSKRTLRLTPALNMPETLYMEMFDRVEKAAQANPQPWRMIPHLLKNTSLKKLLKLAKVGLGTSRE